MLGLLALFIVTLLVERKIIANKIANAAMVLLAFGDKIHRNVNLAR